MTQQTIEFLHGIWRGLGGNPDQPASVAFSGDGDLPSVFAVSDLAAAGTAACGLAIAEFLTARGGAVPPVSADRRLASYWCVESLRPIGWTIPPAWDPIAGDYQARDGWIRLHTNAPHHRAAALSVLKVPADKDAVTSAVAHWLSNDLEDAVVGAGGCAAAMRDLAGWSAHPAGQAVAAEALAAITATSEAAAPKWAMRRDRPLAGIRVLDLTRVLAGPVATRLLAGFGAEVLRIDPPDWEEPGVIPSVTLGKHCARLDLKRPDGRNRLTAMLAEADVLVHGYRPGALAGLGLDEAARDAIRPGLVDVALDAYGWTGPWHGRRGFDSLVQMSSGIAAEGMRRFGTDRPKPLPVQALDHATGYIMAAAVIRGLTRRLITGAGSRTRTSLARTAALLTGAGVVEPGAPFADLDDADFNAEIEATGWGPARRLLPPVIVAGAPMRWDLPARPLGSAAPIWPAH